MSCCARGDRDRGLVHSGGRIEYIAILAQGIQIHSSLTSEQITVDVNVSNSTRRKPSASPSGGQSSGTSTDSIDVYGQTFGNVNYQCPRLT